MKVFRAEHFEEARKSMLTQAWAVRNANEEGLRALGMNPETDNPEQYAKTLELMSELLVHDERLIVDVDIVPRPNEQERNDLHFEPLPYPMMAIGLETMEPLADGKDIASLIMVTDMEDGTMVMSPWCRLSDKKASAWVPSKFVTRMEKGSGRIMFLDFPGLMSPIREEDKQAAGEISLMVHAIAKLINCANVELETKTPSGLRRNRAKKKGFTIKPYRVIKLPNTARYAGEPRGGHHASPALHHRRGHYRTLKRGTRYEHRVWVRPAMVGDPRRGKIKHDYTIRERE